MVVENEDKQEFTDKCNEHFNEYIETQIRKIFENVKFGNKEISLIKATAYNILMSHNDQLYFESPSGIVITGFGKLDVFPVLSSFLVSSITFGKLKFRMEYDFKINHDQSAIVIPFAQMDMVQTFIDGISPNFRALYNQLLSMTVEHIPKMLIDALGLEMTPEQKQGLEVALIKSAADNIKDGITKINDYQEQRYSGPILKVVEFLPKNELADMAEALVNLTCLRKKISMDDESVGGPIDVAVISKGDGLVWIKMKTLL